jgi:cardiolipin-specific phospholipase
VEFSKSGAPSADSDTIILAHGFGSGLGFFYQNVDALLRHPSVGRVVLVDWLGMGGSERPQCYLRPIRGWSEYTTSWCDSRYSPSQAVEFFIDPFHEWMQSSVLDGINKGSGKVVLVGHSLGGYLSARFALAYPSTINKLVLASPVGFPKKPDTLLKGSQLPTSLRILDALWSGNMTPQQLVRLMGATQGRRNTKRVLQGRIPHLKNRIHDLDLLADYLYHITVADPSGEFAMNSLLEPVVSAEVMGVFAREPLQQNLVELDMKSSTIENIKVLFGDHDWMRPNESSARKTMENMKKRLEIHASVEIIPNAGHHLYSDNGPDFVKQILG